MALIPGSKAITCRRMVACVCGGLQLLLPCAVTAAALDRRHRCSGAPSVPGCATAYHISTRLPSPSPPLPATKYESKPGTSGRSRHRRYHSSTAAPGGLPTCGRRTTSALLQTLLACRCSLAAAAVPLPAPKRQISVSRESPSHTLIHVLTHYNPNKLQIQKFYI